MTKLEQLNKELSENILIQTEIRNKIDTEYKLEQLKQTESFWYLINKYFKSNNNENYCYKILNISKIYSDNQISVIILACTENSIHRCEKIHDIENVTEITQQQFDSNLIQACNNME